MSFRTFYLKCDGFFYKMISAENRLKTTKPLVDRFVSLLDSLTRSNPESSYSTITLDPNPTTCVFDCTWFTKQRNHHPVSSLGG